MDVKSFFTSCSDVLQRRYEALRAHYVDGYSLKQVAEMFGFSIHYLKKLRSESAQTIKRGQNPFFVQRKPGPKRRFTKQEAIQDIIALRKQNHSISDIQAFLCAKGEKLSLSCIDNLLKDEGFAPLYRRTRQERSDTLLPKTLTPPASETLILSSDEFYSEKGAAPLIFLPLNDSSLG
jgi:transposase